ncbi:ATP synthase subunit C [Caproicibacter sp.]|uniref:ATP synthase subunit C n=1 Tax=Caproicibacter sp. TaxID=2814884 RepID=UPI00398953FD
MSIALFCLPIIFLILSTFLAIHAIKHGRSKRNAMMVQMIAFVAVCAITVSVPAVAHAATSTQPTASTTTSQAAPASSGSSSGLGMIAAALSTGFAAIGAGIAVGATAPAAIGAISEDPKALGKSMIFVALGEGIAIYGLLMSILILNKV